MNIRPPLGGIKRAEAYLLPPKVKPKNRKKKYTRINVAEQLDEAQKQAAADSLCDYHLHVTRFLTK